ncbi:zinc ribbon domain-containing protein [Marinithermus hydrothermalis]|uniref:Uncharacterized protein n=1 Tax=Marinithermus hydrothermalis (strain DSM 14884 / JCM 11576 / T1) TaxID=869210 RepID=F2NPS5_MARHT|nr:protein of unknown function DUF164 [Marinithermus hydrothermalis DSM 14884]
MNGASALAELYRLQERDLELDRIKEEEARLPEELTQTRARWDELSERLAELRERHHELQLEYQQNDLELKDLTQKKTQAQEEQLQATSAREQTQYENRIQQLSTRIDELTELTMPLLEELEALEREIERVRNELEALRPKLEELESQNEARIRDLEAVYQEKYNEREAMARGIPKSLLREYEAIRRARKGVGIAVMVKKGSSFRCAACSVQLPMHVAQRVHQGTQVVRCPSCGRILWKGEPKPTQS